MEEKNQQTQDLQMHKNQLELMILKMSVRQQDITLSLKC